MPQIALVARCDFSKHGLTQRQGDHFETEAILAASLVYQRLARFRTREDNQLDAEQPRKKRAYRRRDLTAEP